MPFHSPRAKPSAALSAVPRHKSSTLDTSNKGRPSVPKLVARITSFPDGPARAMGTSHSGMTSVLILATITSRGKVIPIAVVFGNAEQ